METSKQEALAIIRDIKSWDCDPERGLLSLPLELRQRMQAALESTQPAEQRPAVPEGWRQALQGCAEHFGMLGHAGCPAAVNARALLSAQPAEQRPTPAVQGEPVYLYRRLGLNDFVTCDFTRYTELSGKPNSFETKILYAAPQPAEQQPAPDVAELLNRIIPRIDAGGPNPIDPDIHCCEWTLHRDRERIHAEFADALAAYRKPSVAPCCGDPGDCWEPCGDLGKSEAHVRVSDHSPDAAKMVPVPYELLCRLADEDFRSEVPDEWVPEMTGPDGSRGPATFTVGDLRAAADLVRAFEGGEA